MRKMNSVDFADKYVETEQFEDYVQDSHWNQSFNTDRALCHMLDNAEERGVEIVNLDSFDADQFFWEVYNSMERGLS